MAAAPTAVLRGHLADVQAACYVPLAAEAGGRDAVPTVLATGSLDGVVMLWDGAHPASPLHRWVAHGGGVTALLPAGPGRFWSQGRDGWVYLWRLPVAADGWGGTSIGAPRRLARVPVGFGSFCRMAALPAWGGGGATLLAAPSLHSDAVEVWAVEGPGGGGGAPGAGGGALGGEGTLADGAPGAPDVTPVHEQSAPPPPPPGVEDEGAAPGGATRATRLAVLCIPPRVVGLEGPAAAAVLQPPSDLPQTVGDGDHHYTPASERAEADALGEAAFSALSRQQRATGMVTCVALLDPALALPGWRGRGGDGEGRGRVPLALAVRPPEAARARGDGGGGEGGDDDAHGPVAHPLPQAGSLREMLQLRRALEGDGGGEPGGGTPSCPPPSPPPSPEGHPLPLARPPAYLLAATYENGRLYVLADAPPARRGRGGRRPAPGGGRGAGLAALRRLAEDDGGTGDEGDDDVGGAPPDRPLDGPAGSTRPLVLVDLHLSTDPLLTFTLDPRGGYVRGVAGGAGGDLVLFTLDIPARTGAVTRRIPLATPGVSLSALVTPPPPQWWRPGGVWGEVPPRARASPVGADNADGGGGAWEGGSLVATGGWDASVRLVDLGSGQPVAALAWHGASVYALAAAQAPPGEAGDSLTGGSGAWGRATTPTTTFRVASGAKDGRVAVWTLEVELDGGWVGEA